MTYKEILDLTEKHMLEIENGLSTSLYSGVGLVNDLIYGTIKGGGKRIRPIFVVLASHMCRYYGPLITKVGIILELVHTASLLHDDVVDEAVLRRGKPSANRLYGNAATVLSGDRLYTQAFISLLSLPDIDFSYTVIRAVGFMSEGEILQLTKTGDVYLSMEEYLRIIYGKTAALFSATCECGALLGDKNKRKLLSEYGCNVGYAFQMRDDLLDYFGEEDVIGKKPGTDLCERKITLPIILLLSKASQNEKLQIEEIFSSHEDTGTKLSSLMPYFERYRIKEKSTAVIQSYIDQALSILSKFPDSVYRTALYTLTESLGSRES